MAKKKTRAVRSPVKQFTGLKDSIEKVLIKTLRSHPQNPRLHDEQNIQIIMRSISEFKQLAPLVIWGKQNYVIVGNGRLEAAKRLGWKEIEIVRADHLTEQQALAYMIADNKATDTSEFDFQMVAQIMGDLSEKKVDLSLTGFADYEVEPLMQAEWQPPAVDDMPTVGGGLTVKFTDEEKEQIEEALEMLRRYEGFEKVKDAAGLVTICHEWMGGLEE